VISLVIVGVRFWWEDEKVLAKVAADGLHGDRTAQADRGLDHRRHGLPQEGYHSVGVARTRGELGKQTIAKLVSLSLANADGKPAGPPIGCIFPPELGQ